MRAEDWTSREAEVRWAAPRALRAARSLPHGPDDTTLDRFLRRLDTEGLAQVWSAVVDQRMPRQRPRAPVAGNATGLTPGAVSPCLVTRAKAREPGFTWRDWLQWIMAGDVDRRLIPAQTARRGPTHDGATWRPLVSAAPERGPMALVLADAACDSERNHQHLRQALRAQRIIPAKRGGAEWQMQGVRAHMRRDCPAPLYARRAVRDSVLSAVKRQRSAHAPGRALDTQGLQALRWGVAYNISRL